MFSRDLRKTCRPGVTRLITVSINSEDFKTNIANAEPVNNSVVHKKNGINAMPLVKYITLKVSLCFTPSAVQLTASVPDFGTVGVGWMLGRTSTQGPKITQKNLLSLL